MISFVIVCIFGVAAGAFAALWWFSRRKIKYMEDRFDLDTIFFESNQRLIHSLCKDYECLYKDYERAFYESQKTRRKLILARWRLNRKGGCQDSGGGSFRIYVEREREARK